MSASGYISGLKAALEIVQKQAAWARDSRCSTPEQTAEHFDEVAGEIRRLMEAGTVTVTSIDHGKCTPREPNREAKTGHQFENDRCRWCNESVKKVLR